MHRLRPMTAAYLIAAITCLTGSPQAIAGSAACESRVNNSHEKLLECITVEGVRRHQAELQSIADMNYGHRVAGSPGHDASVAYAAQQFAEAGYDVTVQPFTYFGFIQFSPVLLDLIAPGPVGPVPTVIMSYSGSGDVTANVSTLSVIDGCNASDYAGFPAGHIALISRGVCTFALKATNAYNAGASGVVIYNNIPGTLNGTLGSSFGLAIPVTAVTLDVGQQLASTAGLVMRLRTETLAGDITSFNVLAESRSGDANNVIMVGAHLDSVNNGPGIQDNGSGSAAIIETARQMAKVEPRNKVRFALWGAEEAGLIGSTYYVDTLSSEDRDRIALYLNFDMIGSPNHVFFIYDGDDSDGVGAGPGPEGSAQIEALFAEFYTQNGYPYKGTDFSGRSDYGPFIAWGIPAGGLFTGAEGIKTPDEAALWGGVAGQQFDPCYHLACDTYDNISLLALDVNSDAVGYATLQYAMSTQAVNGKRGKGNFRLPVAETELLTQ